MNQSNKIVLFLALLLIAHCLTAGSSHAIPAFSREHNAECTTCHTIFPELNEYGDAFLKNGFVWAKQSATPDSKVAVKGEGDPATLKKLKEQAPESLKNDDAPAHVAKGKSEPLWLAGLPQTLPLSIAATLDASYNDDLDYDKLDLSTRAVSLLAGGVIQGQDWFLFEVQPLR